MLRSHFATSDGLSPQMAASATACHRTCHLSHLHAHSRQENYGKGDFAGDKRLSQPAGGAACRAGAACLIEGTNGSRSRRSQGGQKSEHNGGEKRNRQSEQQGWLIEAEYGPQLPAGLVEVKAGAEKLNAPNGQKQTRPATGHTDQKTLGQHLAQNPRSTRAQSGEAFTATPSASVITATIVKPGVRTS